ncbi:hypothetical protein Sjap_002572 [Stephania japonica]|uniref:tRNA/rRNA methyltransferase SpoU type domain-containing protein n=1 Tax=Stephania japonica TaxID=461633 RepID=A0AAP0PSR6_9MAGN
MGSSSSDGDISIMSHVASLTKIFASVTPSAIPAIVDCILISSTQLSPSILFEELLQILSDLAEDILKERGKWDLIQPGYIVSFTAVLCHLINKSGTYCEALRSFILRGFIPLVMIADKNEHELLNQITQQLCDVVFKSNRWDVIEETLVPFSLRSIGLSIGMLLSSESAFYEWSGNLGDYEPNVSHEFDSHKKFVLPISVSWPLDTSCHILTTLLSNYLENHPTALDGVGFAGNLLWDLCDLAIRMLSEFLEFRSSALRFLLPFIMSVFVSHSSFQVFLHGQIHVLSRDNFLGRIWICCRSLFCLGQAERRDGYNILYLYHSLLLNSKESEVGASCNGFEWKTATAEPKFWDEIRIGLVDKEAFIRKQSLCILKMSLQINGEQYCYHVFGSSLHRNSQKLSMTKRGKWAEEEAKSLGLGKICSLSNSHLSVLQSWTPFLLLYEMLEEYGTHLVEAAWNHQISLLLHHSIPQDSSLNTSTAVSESQVETSERAFHWLAVLWERGLCHENPQVRCLIMQSFLGIDWDGRGKSTNLVLESFVLGSLILALNDNAHHNDFGVNGVYSSKTIEGASKFLHKFCCRFGHRKRVQFIHSLASFIKQESFCRAGLMALSVCIASAACQPQLCEVSQQDMIELDFSERSSLCNNYSDLLDTLRLIIDNCKQHFNPNYRLKVCEKILEAAVSVLCACDVPLEKLTYFISTVPREFTDFGGSLRNKLQTWLSKCCNDCWISNADRVKTHILNGLCDFPQRFINYHNSPNYWINFDDEDLESWESEAQRWTRFLFLSLTLEHQFKPVLEFLQNFGGKICRQLNHREWLPPKFLILVLCLIQELWIFKEKLIDSSFNTKSNIKSDMVGTFDQFSSTEAADVFEIFTHSFHIILVGACRILNSSCSIFWSSPASVDIALPGSIRGKLGGPCQRRLASSYTTAVLQAILSIKSVAFTSLWCLQLRKDDLIDSALIYLWSFFWKVIASPFSDSEAGAEIYLAAYEALVPTLNVLESSSSPIFLDVIKTKDKLLVQEKEKPLLDSLVCRFLHNVNNFLAAKYLARSRRASLITWKVCTLFSLLEMLYFYNENEIYSVGIGACFSCSTIKCIFEDLIQSLENAGESSVLPMLRSIRLVLGLIALGRLDLFGSSYTFLDKQMMNKLVHSSWILYVSCTKRRISSLAALLSSVLHCSVFGDERMHESVNDVEGPLKWFIQKVLDEGTKSPRTIRLAALHLTGLWLLNPKIIKYYIKELKLLSLHGSVAFDEDFEAELAENHDARVEVSLLAQSPDVELTKVFMNTELYARVSVAVLFSKLADFAEKARHMEDNDDCMASLQAGKYFLLELLDSVVNDKDLAKELYKKFSAIHRKKVRAWQMICILSRFVDEEIVGKVTSSMHLCLYRNNLPAVRQYLETFAIYIYLKFPELVEKQLVGILRDYNMRPQALASYVFIATNIILHTSEEVVTLKHLSILLPPIVPLLTSHHHSLRCFTQLLIHRVLSKLKPAISSNNSESVTIEKRCFEDLERYLAENVDCVRVRAGMEGFLDTFDPKISISPAGIFAARDKVVEFECVPTSLMELVITFLNDVREDLRCTMQNNAATIKNEVLAIGESFNEMEVSQPPDQILHSQVPRDLSWDFQKKITLSKHEQHCNDPCSLYDGNKLGRLLFELEKEDQLLNQALQSRSSSLDKIQANRQHFLVVGSLLDRIPNLAGLARTCEVFRAAGLAVADASIIHDKQFQLISVTAQKWVPMIEVPISSMKNFLKKKKQEGFAILGLEQTANSIPLDNFDVPKCSCLSLFIENEGIPVDIIHILDACVEIPQLGVVRSLNVHVSGAIALWEYTRQQRCNNGGFLNKN